MKFVVSIVLTALLSFIAGLYLPWWGIAPAAGIVSVLIPQKPLLAFFSGFSALFLLWGLLAWVIDEANDSILSGKVAELLFLGGSPILLVLATALVGGLVGGMTALAGSFLQRRR